MLKYQEERKKIQELMKNKYYWNNFVMKRDDYKNE